jgi:hypothetical protein
MKEYANLSPGYKFSYLLTTSLHRRRKVKSGRWKFEFFTRVNCRRGTALKLCACSGAMIWTRIRKRPERVGAGGGSIPTDDFCKRVPYKKPMQSNCRRHEGRSNSDMWEWLRFNSPSVLKQSLLKCSVAQAPPALTRLRVVWVGSWRELASLRK